MTDPEDDRPSQDPEKGSGIPEWRPGDDAPATEPSPSATPDKPHSERDPKGDQPAAGAETSDEAPEPRADRGGFLDAARTRVVALIVAVIAMFGILWIGGEQHYQSCLAKVEAQTRGANDGLTRLVRKTALAKCSRSPF